MSNKRITDLTELTTPTTDDVFPVVDIATNTTTKVQLGNLPVPTAVTTALATKQDTLVSGTNIKTLNSTSLLGSGNIVLTANPSGVSGAIQFSNGSAFASDASNLFWDDTNNRLGIGTNAPTRELEVRGSALIQNVSDTNGTIQIGTNGGGIILNSDNRTNVSLKSNAIMTTRGTGITFRTTSGEPNGAVVGVVGSGSTSATTSLLVQNSGGTEIFKVQDNGVMTTSSSINCGLNMKVSAGGAYIIDTRGYMGAATDGVWTLYDSSASSFNRLQFGGTSSSFPSLKRSTTNLQVRLADDSGYAPIDASLYKVGGTNGFTGTGSYTNFTIVGGIITNAS